MLEERPQKPSTLGDVLYDKPKRLVLERKWAALVSSIGAGDESALYHLYHMAHRIVFTLIMRITNNRKCAEDLTVDVFYGIWQRASDYDAANDTALGWIMRQARARGIEYLDSRRKTTPYSIHAERTDNLSADTIELPKDERSTFSAFAALTLEERRAIEMTFFDELTYTDVAARLNKSKGTVKTWIRSGLHKLKNGLGRDATLQHDNPCKHSELTCAYVAQALRASESAATEAHIDSCPDCRHELENLRPVVERFVFWPTDLLRPITTSLPTRLALRIADKTGKPPTLVSTRGWTEPIWEQVSPGIECKLLATDTERCRISMLVRLGRDAHYPPHVHADAEELHLLSGELWINDRKLLPGHYNYAARGTTDQLVRTDTGCTCFLVTSIKDTLLQ